jgi:LuxR family maltose regulon positive regulatory protein
LLSRQAGRFLLRRIAQQWHRHLVFAGAGMPKKPPQLAKLTRPRLYKAVARERLFHLLDQKREHPVVWIVGPPGAGKTTLAASYLEEAGVPAIWYQMDPGDSDPAGFFYYLKQAARLAGTRNSVALPLLTAEYLPDLAGFARRFLREMFSQLRDDTIIVLDNYHDIAPTSALHGALAGALAEIPARANLIVLSRAEVPSHYAPALVCQTISVLNWQELRLSANETKSLAAVNGIADSRIVERLHSQAEGWIAGLTLMLERLRRGADVERFESGEGTETVFDYFAGLLFDHASTETCDVLMKTAFLPQITATYAEIVTGNSNAIRHVEELHRRHLFTDKSIAQGTLYQYHALFRAFLRHRAARAYSEEERRQIARLAGSALVRGGRTEEAIHLYAEAEDWDVTEQLILGSAATLLRQGRWQTFEEKIILLPPLRVAANPWIQYWLGRSRTFVDPLKAFPVLEKAYQRFEQSRNAVGQLLVSSAMLQAIYVHYKEFTLMDPWIERTANLLHLDVELPSPEDELWVHSMLLVGATYRNPENSMASKSLVRVEQLLSQPFDPNLLVSVASVLHSYGYSTMDAAAEKLAISTARPLLRAPDVTAGCAVLYLSQEGYAHYVYGRHQQAFGCFDEADALATQHGLDNLALANIVWRALTQRRAGMLQEAEQSIQRAEAFPGATQFPSSPIAFVKGCVAYERGNRQFALSMLEQALAITEKTGSHISKMLIRLVSASIFIDCDTFEAAETCLAKAKAEIQGTITEHYLGSILLNESWLAHRLGQFEKRDNLLRQALCRSTDQRTRQRMRWYPRTLSEMLTLAVIHGIEPGIACDLAREFRILPKSIEVEEWPWLIKIYTLGRFEVLLDGKPPEFSRKVPKKVLSLLKAIIAHGSINVPEQKVIDALWPDDDGDAARRSLSATLHRLRNVLGESSAIRQSGGKLSLDEKFCWVDVRAFECQIGNARAATEFTKHLALYRGAFLSQEEDVSWAVSTRERLRGKFIQAVETSGAALESSNSFEAAIELYSRGIEADDLVEPFYQGLMRCYQGLDRRTEAVSAYRRLRETLSITLGVTPSSATQRLFETLRSN